MNSRRDQVQAHAYMVGRLTCALVHAEPDAPETPMRRTRVGAFGGLVIGALLVAGFMVWGLIFPGGRASALASGTLIVGKQTGTRYIYIGRALWPVLNWASARLLLGGQPQVQMVPDSSLASIPHGQPLGIVGAPDSLPSASAVSQAGWLACAGPPTHGSGTARPLVTLAIGMPAATRPVSGRDAVPVQGGTGSIYLLWQGHRLRVDASWIPVALGLGSAPVIRVNPTWLNAVPAGPDLRSLAVPGLGSPGPSLAGQATRAGQVLVVHNVGSPDQFYLAETGGVSPITLTQAALALTDPSTAAAYAGGTVAPVAVSPGVIARVPVSHAALPDGSGAPATPPVADIPAPPEALCVYYAGAATAPQARLVIATPPAGAPPAAGALGVTATPEVANQIKVVPGGGALVRPQSAPGVAGTSLFLVTDLGVKFPLPSASAASALGYRAGTAKLLPATLLGLLPTGPALDLAPLRAVGQGVIAPGKL
jgi:type VII secretion protein EccB